MTSHVVGTLRTNATDYHDTWQDYMSAIINVTALNQITEGGPVIGMADILCLRRHAEQDCYDSRTSRYVMIISVDADTYLSIS